MSPEPGALDEDLLPVATVVFGDRLPQAQAYARELATSGVVRGLIGPREVDRVWERHLLNCAVVAEVIPDGVTVADIGSGAGLPGIPLALARPGARFTLIEPLLRRTQWLGEVLAQLELPNVTVERSRAEDSSARGTADVVTGRAVAPLTRFLPWAAPLLATSGTVVALKGRSAQQEVDEAERELTAWGVTAADVLVCGEDLLAEPTTVVRMTIPQSVTPPAPPAKPSRPSSDRRAARAQARRGRSSR